MKWLRRWLHNQKVDRAWRNAQTEPRCSETHKFCCWVKDKHPDLTLTLKQICWIRWVLDENNETHFFAWAGTGSGRTFVADLLKEYIADGGKI